MTYIYEKEAKSYEDFASGRVLRNAQGATAFPVRLASELYQRSKAVLQSNGRMGDYTVYDPCCGGAYLLTTIGLMHGKEIARLIGSDVDAKVIELARNNLSLVNPSGINVRIDQLQALADEFGKDSHREAIESARRLRELALSRNSVIATTCFQADATAVIPPEKLESKVDLVITDVPYGEVAKWSSDEADPIGQMLEHLSERITKHSVVVIVADKKQKISHDKYRRLERIKIGKRQAAVLALH